MQTVYLAGPMTGLGFAEAIAWRRQFALAMGPLVRCLSPMRGLDHLDNGTPIPNLDESSVMNSPRAVTTQDRWDATRCDVLVANMLGATKVSIGTVMEMAWADAKRTPIVLVMEPSGNPHEHVMLNEAASYRVWTTEDAIAIVRHLFALDG